MQFLCVMASSPCNRCSPISFSPSSPSSSSLAQTNTKSFENVWDHIIKLPSLSTPSHSSPPPTFLTAFFHKHDIVDTHSSLPLSASNNTKKRAQQEDVFDGRHKRMLRNRESALRSRARKQAYNYGLEIKIKHLKEENSNLRRQLEQLRAKVKAKAKANPPKTGVLYRTLTCPF